MLCRDKLIPAFNARDAPCGTPVPTSFIPVHWRPFSVRIARTMTNNQSTSLVTGGAGFIGSHLVDALVARGDTVAVVDDMSSGKPDYLNPAADLFELDIRDEGFANVMSAVRPDVVFHVAAQISVSVSTRNPKLDAETNILGTINILDAMIATGASKMVFVSTGGAMYGEPDSLPAPESAQARPAAPYGASKLAAENYLPIYKALHGTDYSIIRPANVYGPRQDPHGEAGVVAIFTRAMLAGEPIKIFGDGTDERDYVYVEDVVDALVRASGSPETGPYNVGSGIGTSVNEIASTLAALTGYSREPEPFPPRPGDLRRISLDASLAKKELGWSPTTSLNDGLRRTVEWFRSQMSATG